VASFAWAQGPARKLGELELKLLGIQASADPANPTVPKNVASGIRVVATAGGQALDASQLAAFLGTGFIAEAELSGPGLRETVTIPQRAPGDPLPEDPLLLPLPPLGVAGDYTIANLRLVIGSRSVLDVAPAQIPLRVIDQILVTSVKTRPLTLDEIKAKGIVLDNDDYLGFDFSLGLKLDSKQVNFSFPVVFDREGAVVPPPVPVDYRDPEREATPPELKGGAATILPVLLTQIEEPGGGLKVPLSFEEAKQIRIPSVVVIPGNVGYLKQFFSAQLFVANGAPVGSSLVVGDVSGTLRLPAGANGGDPPLALPETVNGPQPATLPVRGLGLDGAPGTDDDTDRFAPAEQGQAEFLIRGEQEGFHSIEFDIRATLEGLPVGPISVGGKAKGGVLVRNPYFDISFTVPSVVRRNENFSVFMTVANIGQGSANDLTVALDPGLAGADLLGPGTQSIPTLGPGQTRVLTFEFKSTRTGAVVASYLGFDAAPGSTVSGGIKFKLGVGESGVALSPDTLALPAAVDLLPMELVEAAMRVLGQAWSVAGAPPGSLPASVARIERAKVQEKALALAETGLRVDLGEPLDHALGGLFLDFFGGPIDPGFDQLLRTTEAGRDLARSLGAALEQAAQAAGGAPPFERALAAKAASGADFLSFAVSEAIGVTVTDASGRVLSSNRMPDALPAQQIPGGAILPLGPVESSPLLGLIAAPASSPYSIELSGGSELSITLPAGDGWFVHGTVTAAAARSRLVVDLGAPQSLTLEEDLDADGSFESARALSVESFRAAGPELISAHVIGPETFAAASEFGVSLALLFDRPVDPTTAADKANYSIPNNALLAAKSQLSRRLVFGTLSDPEGPHLPTTITVGALADARGNLGATATQPLVSRLTRAGGVVMGRVVGSDGTPVDGGFVYYSNWADAACSSNVGAPATISATPIRDGGRYELRYVAQSRCGPFEVKYLEPGTLTPRSLRGNVRYDGEQIVLDIALIGRGSVQGVVRDVQGTPVPGAQVVVLSLTDAGLGKNAQTDGQGRYQVDGLTVGPVTVKAVKGIGLGIGAGRIERAGTTASVDLTLDAGAVRVSGHVYRVEAGAYQPVAGELLTFRLAGGAAAGYAFSDPDGGYVFEGMPVGNFVVSGRTGARSGFGGAPGDDITGFDIVAVAKPETDFGEARGTVELPDGTPFAGAIVAKDVSSLIIEGGVVSGADGSFRLPGLEVGRTLTLGAITRDRKRIGYGKFVVDPVTRVAEDVVIRLSGIGSAEFTVKDAAGEPVANIPVALLNVAGPLSVGSCSSPCGCQAVTTGPDGVAHFEDLPLGQVTAQAIRFGGGVADVARATTSIMGDGLTGVATLRFPGTGVVSGIVRYPPGVFGAGGEVTLTSRVFRNDGSSVCGLVTAVSHRASIDPETGRFRFTGVNLGAVGVSATNPFFNGAASARGTLTENGQELAFDLQFTDSTAGELTGTVYLPDGITPAGAGVEVTADGYSLQNVVVKTDAGGRFEFAKVFPQGNYTLTARDAATQGVARGSVYLRKGLDAAFDLRLKGRGTVRVHVVNGADQPVANAFVRLTESEFPNRAYEGAIEPANEGVLVFERVFEGPFSVEASAPGGGGRTSSALPRVAGASVEVKVRLAVTGKVRGQFRHPDGTPVPFALITLKSGGKTLGQTTTPGSGDEVGNYAFDFVPAGAIRIEAEDPLTTRSGVGIGTLVGQDQELLIDVVAQGLGTVQGLVTSNGVAAPLARVSLVSGSFRASTAADATGHYVVGGVPEGRVDVTASLGDGFLAGTASGTLAGDATTLPLDVALRDSGTVIGQVLAPDGVTSGPASIVRLSVGGVGGGNQAATTGPDGTFRFDKVPAGRASLSADVLGSIDRGDAVADVPAGDVVEVPILLKGVGAVEGRALGSDGSPIAGEVSASGAFGFGSTVVVTSNGQFRLPELPAGAFTITLRARQGAFDLYGTASGVVSPGETTTLDVQVQDSGTVMGIVRRANGVTPAVGAEVRLVLSGNRGSVVLQAGNDGSFTAQGVPLGIFDVSVVDPVTTGRAVLAGRGVRTNGDTVDLGTILIDESAPRLSFLEPLEGTVRARFAGNVELQLEDIGDLDPGSLSITYNGGVTVGGLSVAGNRATGVLSVPNLRVGSNVLKARAADVAGNVGEAEVRLMLLGGSVRGTVTRPDGSPGSGVPVSVAGSEPVTTGADGSFSRAGYRPGTYTVAATDPVTLLTAYSQGTLFDGDSETAPITIQLPAYGSVVGFVKHPSGAPALGVEVTLGSSTTSTLADGSFRFERLPLGQYSMTASDASNGDRGYGSATISAHGQQAPALITLNGVGHARVSVRSAAGASVVGAQVVVTSGGVSYPAPTDGTGVAHLTNVLAGLVTVRATDPVRGLTGEAPGLVQDQMTAEIQVTLEAAGRVEGQVFRFDGSAASDVTVSISGTRTGSTTTDTSGSFAFENVPVGSFELKAVSADGDGGLASGAVISDGQTVTSNVSLNGTGSVRVSVRDADGAAVDQAQVTVSWEGPFKASRSCTSGSDGACMVSGVLAGSFLARAHYPPLDIRGSAPGELEAGATREIVVTLEGLGTLRGHVYEPDGVTPVDSANVGYGVGNPGTFFTTAADGAYQFANVRLGSYLVSADVAGHRRANLFDVTVSSNHEIVERDLVLVGVGTVKGLLRDSAGLPVVGRSVSLNSAATYYGGPRSATTDLDGRYSFAEIPIGSFSLHATRGSERADGGGTIDSHGQIVTKDLRFLAAAATLPLVLSDANGRGFRFQADGRFTGSDLCANLSGGHGLSLVRDGSAADFEGSGNTIATEEAGRELVFGQAGLHGLNVTRKAFVPREGYFVRYLDLLRNDGLQPITVDVAFLTETDFRWDPALIDSSSDDPLVLDASDRWAIVDAPDNSGCGFPVTALGFAGAGATAPTEASFTKVATVSRTETRWNGVTIAPGASVGFMHVVTRLDQATRARASVERLVALPPELLDGLSAEEAAAIVNFSIPADLASTLPPLPALDGEVVGRLVSGDGATPVPNTAVDFLSQSPHFDRSLRVTSELDGTFRFTGSLSPNTWRVVPRAAFDVSSSYTGVSVTRTTAATSDFAPEAQRANLGDLVFTGTSAVEGRVRRADGSVLLGAGVRIEGASGGQIATGTTGSTSEIYRFPVVVPGDYTVFASHPLGSVETTRPLTVVAGQKIVHDVTFPPLGSLAGFVRTAAGVPFNGSAVDLTAPGFGRNVRSESGSYAFPDVPPGTYTLTARDERNFASARASVDVAEGAPTVVDLSLAPLGAIQVTATVAGAPLASAQATWQSEARGPQFNGGCTTNSAGQCTMKDVSGPSVRVRVAHPSNGQSFGEVTVALTLEGQTGQANVVVPGVGSVTGFIRARNGVAQPSPSTNAVSLYHATQNVQLKSWTTTDATGRYTFTNVPVGPLRVRVWRDAFSKGEAQGELGAHGAQLELDVVEPRGVLETAGQKDLWQASFAEGQPIDVWAEGLAIGTAAALADPYLELFGPTGTLLASNDDVYSGTKNASVQVAQAPVSGTYLIAISTRAAGTGGYRVRSNRNDEAHVFTVYGGPTLSGRVTRAPGDAPVAGQRLQVTLPNGVEVLTATAADGRYLLPSFGEGTAALEARDAEDVPVGRAQAAVASAAASTTLDLVVPARGSVSVKVTHGPQLIGGLAVALTSDHPSALVEDRIRSRTTAADGTLATSLPTGTIVARAHSAFDGLDYEASGSLAADGTLALEIAFPVSTAGTVRGVVSGRFGQAPIVGATVEVVGVGTRTTDATGAYRFDGLPSGAYQISARYGSKTSGSQSLDVGDTEIVRDFELAIDVLRGRVTEPDGTGVAASVRTCNAVYTSNCQTTTTASDGSYVFYDPPIIGSPNYQQSLTATLTDGSGLSVSGTAASPYGAVTKDLVLPPTGTIVGTLREATGESLPGREVELYGGTGAYLRSITTDPQGGYVLPHVVPQAVRLVGWAPDWIAGEARGVVVADQVLTLDTTIAQTGRLEGVLLDGTGQPLANKYLYSEPPEALDGTYLWTYTAADGSFGLRVPVGPYRLVYDGQSPTWAAAAAEGVVTAGEVVPTTLNQGSHLWLPYELSGPQGAFKGVWSWQACSVKPCASYPHSVPIGGWHVGLSSLEQEGRALRSLLQSQNRIRYREVHFVPPSGAFARSLLLLTNASEMPTTVTVDSRSLTPTPFSLLATASGDAALDPSDAFVIGRRNDASQGDFALVAGNLLQPIWSKESNAFRAKQEVVLLPGQTRAFVTFTVVRPQGDTSLATQAAALADLSDPEALAGLTEDERAALANFVVPGVTSVVQGAVRNPRGEPLAGLGVRLTSPSGAVQARTTLADGSYLVPAPEVGTHVVEVRDPAGVPVARASTIAGSPGETVSLDLEVPLRGTVTATVRRDAGSLVSGISVSFESDHPQALAEDKARTGVTNTSGVASVTLPIGNVTARVTDPPTGIVSSASGVLAEGAPLALSMRLAAVPRASLDTQWWIPYEAEGVIEVTGWAFRCDGSITSYSLLIDGQPTSTPYVTGLPRSDVQSSYSWCASVGDPGFRFSLDTTQLSLGAHTLQVRVSDEFGRTVDSNARQIHVQAMVRSSLDYPSEPVVETLVATGWAFVCGQPITSHALLIDGSPVPEAVVTVTTRADVAAAYRGQCPSVADEIGFELQLSAEGLTTGDHYAQVQFSDATGAAHATNYISFVVDPALRHAGTLRILYKNGAAAESRGVRVDSIEARLGGSVWSTSVWTEGDTQDEGGGDPIPGAPAAVRIPAGPYRVVFDQDWPPSAVEGVLAEGETRDVVLEHGSHDFRYNGPSGPFVEPWVPGVEPFPEVVELEQDDRAMRSLLVAGSGVRLRRQEYAPPDNSFRRTLVLITNHGNEVRTVDVSSVLPLGWSDWTLVATSSGDLEFDLDDTYAIASDTDGQLHGIVLGGAWAPESVAFEAGGGEAPGQLSATHRLTLAPGETRALLLFSVSGEDAMDVAERAAALTDLTGPGTPPEALLGLTVDERRAIVNVVLPPSAEVGGVVRSPTGESVAGARVGALVGSVLASERVTDGDGSYSFSLDPGAYTLIAIDTASNRPGRATVQAVVGAPASADITLFGDAELGTVEISAPGAAAGQQFRLEVDGYSPFWSWTAALEHGSTSLLVPPGHVTARLLDDPLVHDAGNLVSGGTLRLTLLRRGTGSITGQVVDADWVSVPNARVAVLNDIGAKLADVTADGDGMFAATGLAEGSYLVIAVDPATRLAGSAGVWLPDDEETSITVTLAAASETGTVQVRGVLDATGLPAQGLPVAIESIAFGGVWVEQATLDANGEATFSNVPAASEAIVYALPSGEPSEVVPVVAGGISAVTLRIGESRSPYPVDLTASGDLPYVAWPSSTLEANATGQWTCLPLCSGHSEFYADGVGYYPSEVSRSARVDVSAAGKEVTGRIWASPSLSVTRRTFVPAAGGFARVLDVIENETEAPVDLYYYYDHYMQGGGGAWSLGSTSSGDAMLDASDEYAVIESGDGASPEVAWVFAGAGSPLAPDNVAAEQYDDGSDYSYLYMWVDGTLSLAPGQQVILMRFVAQRPNGETVDAVDIAEKLRSLDPSIVDAALANLTAAERAAIVNFVVPQQ